MNNDHLIKMSLQEDLGYGDITSDYLNLENRVTVAYIVAKQEGILAGLEVAKKVFKFIDLNLNFVAYKKDGDRLQAGHDILKIEGSTRAILSGERVALNFLQRMSGIATLTKEMVTLISPYDVKLLDTRKTTPLWRYYEKYAVRVGGGYNHRFGLYDMIMLKDNHIQAVGSITKAVNLVKERNVNYKVEVEVKNLTEFREGLKCDVDRILLDNMKPAVIRKVVALAEKYYSEKGKKVELEVSGGITFKNVKRFAQTGVDFISTGSVTHSAKALDITLLFRE